MVNATNVTHTTLWQQYSTSTKETTPGNPVVPLWPTTDDASKSFAIFRPYDQALKSLAVTRNTFKRRWIRRCWRRHSPLTKVGRPHTHKHVLSSTPRLSRRSYIDHVHTDTGLSTAGHAAVLVTLWSPRLTGRSPLAADRARQATDTTWACVCPVT